MERWLESLLDAEQMRAVDRWAIESRGIPSLELMEAAGAGLAQVARDRARPGPIRVVCGKGNNGGDGLVAARLIDRDRHRDAEALLLWPPGELSADAATNLKRCRKVTFVEDPAELPALLEGSGAVIDAIFGTGFGGEPRAPAAAAIEAINACDAPVIAADVASGVDAATGEVAGTAVRANVTVAFHSAKPGHWIAPGKGRAGELRVLEIGIPAGAPVEGVRHGLIGGGILRALPPRTAGSTKFSSGHVVVIGGSRGLTGATCLSAEAAMRSGAGYATVCVPADLEPIFETKLTEVMSVGCTGPAGSLGTEAADRILDACGRAGAVLLGPGLGREEGAAELARDLATRIAAPLVIDADGLNALAGRLETLAGRAAPTILTPHEGELGRLLGCSASEVSARRHACAREAAERSGAIVVLKGDGTIVADSEAVAINGIGVPALATAGTGDVLGGMLAALLARGLAPFEAACAAVIAHVRAGRAAADRVGPESVIATDVIAAIPAGLAP